jgi:hypothetical protein
MAKISAHIKKGFLVLQKRYGPRYGGAMAIAVLIGVFLPVPGSIFVTVVLVVAVAEVHRRIATNARSDGRGSFLMSRTCDVILDWSATPAELNALGTALWSWCQRTGGDGATYRNVDSQSLADLIAGERPLFRLPPVQAQRQSLRFLVHEGRFPDRGTTIESLRHEIPAEGVYDVLVDGITWNSRG